MNDAITWIDSHAHLDLEEFTGDGVLTAVLRRAAQAGTLGVILPAIDAASLERILRIIGTRNDPDLAERMDTERTDGTASDEPVQSLPMLWFATGIQPNSTHQIHPDDGHDDDSPNDNPPDTGSPDVGNIPDTDGSRPAEDWDRIVAAVHHPQCVAVGEIGLDDYWDFSPRSIQERWFRRQLRLARRHDLPVLVHCRDQVDAPTGTGDRLVAMMRDVAQETSTTFRGPLRGVIHSFSGDAALAEACLGLGFFLSFSGVVTYSNRKFDALRDVVRSVPADRLLVETDSPYLTPSPLRGKAPVNEPAFIIHTLNRLASLRGTDPAELAAQIRENTRQLFRLAVATCNCE